MNAWITKDPDPAPEMNRYGLTFSAVNSRATSCVASGKMMI
jgi:hypothetical protein